MKILTIFLLFVLIENFSSQTPPEDRLRHDIEKIQHLLFDFKHEELGTRLRYFSQFEATVRERNTLTIDGGDLKFGEFLKSLQIVPLLFSETELTSDQKAIVQIFDKIFI